MDRAQQFDSARDLCLFCLIRINGLNLIDRSRLRITGLRSRCGDCSDGRTGRCGFRVLHNGAYNGCSPSRSCGSPPFFGRRSPLAGFETVFTARQITPTGVCSSVGEAFASIAAGLTASPNRRNPGNRLFGCCRPGTRFHYRLNRSDGILLGLHRRFRAGALSVFRCPQHAPRQHCENKASCGKNRSCHRQAEQPGLRSQT